MRIGAIPLPEGPQDVTRDRKHVEDDHPYGVPNNYDAPYTTGMQQPVKDSGTLVESERKGKRKFQNNRDKLLKLVRDLNLDQHGDSVRIDIIEKASRISSEMLQSLVKKAKTGPSTSHPEEAYHLSEVREFSLALQNVSPEAYR